MIDLLPQVPVNLLRAGRIFVFEPPPGMKANMLRTFSNIPVARMCKVRSQIVKQSVGFFYTHSFFFIRRMKVSNVCLTLNGFSGSLVYHAVVLLSQSPNERARLYFLLAWFHAVIQERLRYAPLGWSKKYEFGESDLRSACDTIDTWLDDTAKV